MTTATNYLGNTWSTTRVHNGNNHRFGMQIDTQATAYEKLYVLPYHTKV